LLHLPQVKPFFDGQVVRPQRVAGQAHGAQTQELAGVRVEVLAASLGAVGAGPIQRRAVAVLLDALLGFGFIAEPFLDRREVLA